MGTYLLPRCPSLWVFVGDRNRSYEMLFFYVSKHRARLFSLLKQLLFILRREVGRPW